MDNIVIDNLTDLPSGENLTQKAGISLFDGCIDYEILSRRKELEFLDYLNLSEAVKILGEFFDVNCAVISKEASVCAVALGSDCNEAFSKVIDCNPLALNQATIGFSTEVTLDVATQLSALNIKNIIAPKFSKEAFAYLLDTPLNLVVVNTPLHELQGFNVKDMKVTPFGILVQEQNNTKLTKDNFRVVSISKPSPEQIEDAVFGWKVSKHLKSRGAVIVKDFATRGVSQGKYSTSSAVESVMDQACEYSKDAILSIDGAVESKDVINTAIQGRIGLIIESGDSKNSSEILKYADKYEIAVIFTNIKNNRY